MEISDYASGDGRHGPATIAAYLPLVQRVVKQLGKRLPANVQEDDLISAGISGLVDSLQRNGGDHGVTFPWYARTRIRGAIFDELRAQDGRHVSLALQPASSA